MSDRCPGCGSYWILCKCPNLGSIRTESYAEREMQRRVVCTCKKSNLDSLDCPFHGLKGDEG